MLSEGELDDRLHRANPVSRAALDNERIQVALASTLRDVELGARPEPVSRPPRRRVYRRRWAMLGVAMTTAGVASLVGVETLTGGMGGAGLPLAVTPAAAAQLGRVAHAAAAQVAPGAGQFQYTAVEEETSADPSLGGTRINFSYEQTQQTWEGATSADDTRGRLTSSGITFASPQDRANYLANKSQFDLRYYELFGTDDLTATGLVFDSVSPTPEPSNDPSVTPIANDVYNETERPGSPQELLRDLTLSFDGQPADLWAMLFTILRHATDSQLRATAYKALAYVPGTTMLGNRTDQLGRVGPAIEFADPGDGTTQTIILSPSTGYLLEDDTSSSASSKTGAQSQREVYLDRAVVNSITALPDGGSQPITAATKTTTTSTTQTSTDSQATTSTPQS
jgi:hypothetical protein